MNRKIISSDTETVATASKERSRVEAAAATTLQGAIPVLATIRAKLPDMTGVQQRIGRFVLSNPERSFNLSISELARETGAKSESTIVRFYRLLGFTGYHDFKVTLATEVAGNSFYHSYEDVTDMDDVAAIEKKIFHGAIRTLDDNLRLLDVGALQEAVELLAASKRVFLLGFATSAAIAYDAYFRFSAIGLDCHWSSDPHVNAVLLSEPREGDVIFAISNSGETRDVVEPAGRARPTAKVIALTGHPRSQLGAIADVCLSVVSEEMNYRSDVIVSRVVQTAVIGTLFVCLSARKGVAGKGKLKRTRQSLSYLKY